MMGISPQAFWGLSLFELRAVLEAHNRQRRERLEDFETLSIMSGIAHRAKNIPKTGSMIKRDEQQSGVGRVDAEALKKRLADQKKRFDEFERLRAEGKVKTKRVI